MFVLNPDDTRALLIALAATRALVRDPRHAEDFMEGAPVSVWLLFDAHKWSVEPKTTNDIRTTALGIVGELLRHDFAAARLVDDRKTADFLLAELIQHSHPQHALAAHIAACTWRLESAEWAAERAALVALANAERTQHAEFCQALEVRSL